MDPRFPTILYQKRSVFSNYYNQALLIISDAIVHLADPIIRLSLSIFSLVSLSFGSLRPIHRETSSETPDQVTVLGLDYGWKGPGAYHITNLVSNINVAHNDSIYRSDAFLE